MQWKILCKGLLLPKNKKINVQKEAYNNSDKFKLSKK